MEDHEEHQEVNLPTIESLVERAQVLLGEIETFKKHALQRPYRQQNVPMREFEGGIRSELEHLRKVDEAASKDEEDERGVRPATARSSNLGSFEMIWSTAKRSQGVTAFRKWFTCDTTRPRQRTKRTKAKKAKRALVDVVASDGLEWFKVSGATEKRLLFDIAKEGWGRFDDDSDADSSDDEGVERQFQKLEMSENADLDGSDAPKNPASEHIPEVPLLRSARDLVEAARSNRVRGRIPQVHFVLPRLYHGGAPEIDILLSKIKHLGVRLTLAADVASMPLPADPPLDSVLHTMPVDRFARLSSTLNIDCTILISLISDISHIASLEAQPWYNTMLREQLKFEQQEALLPNVLYPVLLGRKLVCTATAAKQCRVIVATIGNETEKVRCGAILDQRSKAEASGIIADTSDHEVPHDLEFPIEVVADDAVMSDAAPRSALSDPLLEKIGKRLSAINRSVFLFGWRTGYTTISSNNNTMREIETLLEEYRADDGGEDEVAAPDCWVCLPRSVVGKYDEVRQSRKEKRNLNPELQFQEGANDGG